MKASELITRFSLMSDPWSRDAAVMLKRYLALADELESRAKSYSPTATERVVLEYAAKRMRVIAEGP